MRIRAYHASAVIAGAAVLAAIACGGTGAAELGSADGAALAELRCGRCHATGSTGDSPQRGVIPFHRLHERFPIDMLAEAQRTSTISGHDEMPAFELTPEEVRALLRHIDSLAPERPAYVVRDRP